MAARKKDAVAKSSYRSTPIRVAEVWDKDTRRQPGVSSETDLRCCGFCQDVFMFDVRTVWWGAGSTSLSWNPNNAFECPDKSGKTSATDHDFPVNTGVPE